MSTTSIESWIAERSRIMALTGAGVSTGSGIPDYRDEQGEWKHSRPVMYQDFIGSEVTRQRYWGRSVVGWKRVAAAKPNAAHIALANLQQDGPVTTLVTQNVDGLHQRAGSQRVIDLHGKLGNVVCLSCGSLTLREVLQQRLLALNPGWDDQIAIEAPDGDARLVDATYEEFVVAHCEQCGGLLKPDVVFFGESVPKERTDQALQALNESEGLLIAGSSLMVYSGYRFVRHARQMGVQVAIVNKGTTRADDDADIKVNASCESVLTALATGTTTLSSARAS